MNQSGNKAVSVYVLDTSYEQGAKNIAETIAKLKRPEFIVTAFSGGKQGAYGFFEFKNTFVQDKKLPDILIINSGGEDFGNLHFLKYAEGKPVIIFTDGDKTKLKEKVSKMRHDNVFYASRSQLTEARILEQKLDKALSSLKEKPNSLITFHEETSLLGSIKKAVSSFVRSLGLSSNSGREH